MPFSTAGKNTLLDSWVANGGTLYASLHSASPGDNGANEINGGSPAYARKAVTVGAASSGTKSATTQPQFDVPSGTTITHVGWWSAVSSGTFYGYAALSNSETYGGQGTYTLTAESFTIT